MTRQEAIKMLSILKAAYPNSYKGLSKDEANGIIGVWATQFYSTPYNVVMIAVNKLIATNTFPPSISEVKQKLHALHFEAQQMLDEHEMSLTGWKLNDDDPNETPVFIGKRLDDKTLATVKEIIRYTTPERYGSVEPSLDSLLTNYNAYLLTEESDGLLSKQ